jgi:hypothetical protein
MAKGVRCRQKMIFARWATNCRPGEIFENEVGGLRLIDDGSG